MTALAVVALPLLLVSQGPLERQSPGRVEGVVKDKDTKAPIEGVAVYLYGIFSNGEAPIWDTATTNNRGEFRFTNIKGFYRSPMPFYLTCVKRGYRRHPARQYFPGKDEPASGIPTGLFTTRAALDEAIGVFQLGEAQVARLAIELERGGGLEGTIRLRTPEGIIPFSGEVGLWKRREPHESFLTQERLQVTSTSTDSAGHFELQDLSPSANYFLFVVTDGHPGDTVQNIEVLKGQISKMEPILDRTDPTGIQGTVRIGGSPATRGTVILRRIGTASTSLADVGCDSRIRSDGSYTCLGLSPGPYEFEAYAAVDGRLTWSRNGHVTIESGRTLNLDVDLPANTPGN